MTCGMGASTAMIYTDALFGAERVAAHFVKALRALCRLGKSAQKSGWSGTLGEKLQKTKRYRNIFLFYKMFCSK